MQVATSGMESRHLSLSLEIRLNIAGDTEIHPLHSLAHWVKVKIGATPAHGFICFTINPRVLRTPLMYDRNS
jgi:hypothetical protein